jgi:hypothetical protein
MLFVGTGPFPSRLVPFEIHGWSLFKLQPAHYPDGTRLQGAGTHTYTQEIDTMNTTYRLIMLDRKDHVGRTALTPDLARLVPAELSSFRSKHRLGIERTDWIDDGGEPRPVRSVLIEAETAPWEWELGARVPDEK